MIINSSTVLTQRFVLLISFLLFSLRLFCEKKCQKLTCQSPNLINLFVAISISISFIDYDL